MGTHHRCVDWAGSVQRFEGWVRTRELVLTFSELRGVDSVTHKSLEVSFQHNKQGWLFLNTQENVLARCTQVLSWVGFRLGHTPDIEKFTIKDLWFW